MKECNLSGDPYKAEWGKAVSAWTAYLSEGVTDVSKNKAQNEITVINNRARDNFRRVKNRSTRLIDGNQKADAIEMLKKELDRFKGTESEKDIEGMLKELDT